MRSRLFHWRPFLGIASLATLGILSAMEYIHWVFPAFYGVMSLFSFGVYGWDKYKAVKSHWRTPEKYLWGIDMSGGWPGGLIAQQFFNHKRSKGAYQIVFWLAVIFNLVILAAVLGLWR